MQRRGVYSALGGWLSGARDSDLVQSLKASKITITAATALAAMVAAAILAPWIAPHHPYDLAQINLLDSRTPPAWIEGGDARFLLGTDDQGRDLLSSILYGLRISLSVGMLSVVFAGLLGICVGLLAGYAGGAIDSLLMRVADVQLTFPAILIALLLDGSIRALASETRSEYLSFWILVTSIGLSFWANYARIVRAATLVEKNKDYVLAARIMGIGSGRILVRHLLPNVVGPMLVVATVNLAFAIVLEATLSFLGVGLPLTQPSLGTLIRIGNNYLFAGEWWIVAFPSFVLTALILSVNIVGDWLRDALNPSLR